MRERDYALLLASSGLLSAAAVYKLYEFFGSWHQVWEATVADWRRVGLKRAMAESLGVYRAGVVGVDVVADFQRKPFHFVMAWDEDFPQKLLEIDNPPAWLFIWGNLQEVDFGGLAVVGSRVYSPYAQRVCEQVVSGLSYAGMSIISGLARGVDSMAHNIALRSGARTVAFLGSGLEYIYPAENLELAQKIVKSGGAIISEYYLNARPESWHFPLRNRLIAGLSVGVLVVEARLRSGSLITARLGLEQGREVFAVMGSIFAAQSRGSNELISSGQATAIATAQDIISVFDLQGGLPEQDRVDIYGKNSVGSGGKKLYNIKLKIFEAATPDEQLVWDFIGDRGLRIDEMVMGTGIGIEIVSSMLMLWQIQGMVKMIDGEWFKV